MEDLKSAKCPMCGEHHEKWVTLHIDVDENGLGLLIRALNIAYINTSDKDERSYYHRTATDLKQSLKTLKEYDPSKLHSTT